MLHAISASAAFDPRHALNGTLRTPAPTSHSTMTEERKRARVVADYLQGWAEADPVRIASVAAPDYRFGDPFVGTFSALALPRYFGALRARTGLPALAGREHLSFVLSGPMDARLERGTYQFWREAPRLGLTGTALITVGPDGVRTEHVAYDLNMASDQLRAHQLN
jgi:hypothetical protein